MDKSKMRARLASLSFSEKIKILEKLRDRDQAIAASGLRRERRKTVVQLIAYVEPTRMHELDEASGYCSHDQMPDQVIQLCNEFSLPYRKNFVSIAVLDGNDDVHQAVQNTNKGYGIPLLLKIDDVLPLIKIVCSDDLQNVADDKRGHEVLLEDCSRASLPEKMRLLADAVSKRCNATYAEARIYKPLTRTLVDCQLSPEENDPITQADMWSDEEEEEVAMRSLTVELDGREYSGEYEIRGKVITVFYSHGRKSTQLGGHKDIPETMARILLGELVRAERKRLAPKV